MTPFGEGQGGNFHQTEFTGLVSDTLIVNSVTVRCEAGDDYVLPLLYRALPDAKPGYPRTGNLWGSWHMINQGAEHAARIDLYNGAGFTEEQAHSLREINPNILITTSINTVERSEGNDEEVPDDYWLHDTTGNRIEVWPGAWRLNLTKPEVADFQARYAYQILIDGNLSADGCFFDNFFTSISWLDADMWGNPVALDADDDGEADDPAVLDEAWRKGVFDELRAFRKWMPFAIVTGHLPNPDGELGAIFNGDSLGFIVPQVREGLRPFADLLDMMLPWEDLGQKPLVTMMEAAPPMQIGYGYSYDPQEVVPASTLEFARTFWPNMRFGLGATLLGDGYYAYEYGDTWHGNDWWYDELDYDLGEPCGAYSRIDIPGFAPTEHMEDGGFENASLDPWNTWTTAEGDASVTFKLDTQEKHEGKQSLQVDLVNGSMGEELRSEAMISTISITKGVQYDLSFWARASSARELTVGLTKPEADWDSYGFWGSFDLTADWQQYTETFEATVTVDNARLDYVFGYETGSVWLDDIHMTEHPADVFTRDFKNGKVIVNGTEVSQTVTPGGDLARLEGTQAPLIYAVLDDADAGCALTGEWQQITEDSGDWTAEGPFYHNWRPGMFTLDGEGEAVWNLPVAEETDTYSIDAWWPAAPSQSAYTTVAIYEVVVNGEVVANGAADQTKTGDEWHRVISYVSLSASDEPVIVVRNGGDGTLVADAFLIQSAARYNNGSAVGDVTLAPFDAIILRRTGGGCP
jgi:hypothetical protein